MATVMIMCPLSRRGVSTGIEIDPAGFDRLALVQVRMTCPECGREHYWSKDSAWLRENGVEGLGRGAFSPGSEFEHTSTQGA